MPGESEMEKERLPDSSSCIQASRQLTPIPIDRPEQQEALGYEELEERLAPGGTTYCTVKKTAGWGC
jgi:hypothetical protein